MQSFSYNSDRMVYALSLKLIFLYLLTYD